MRTRFHNITVKIPAEETGLKGSVFIHADFHPDGALEEITFSDKMKDGSVLDNLLGKITEIANKLIKGELPD